MRYVQYSNKNMQPYMTYNLSARVFFYPRRVENYLLAPPSFIQFADTLKQSNIAVIAEHYDKRLPATLKSST